MTDEEALELLVGLLEIPSLTGEEHHAVEFLAGAMRRIGLTAEIDAAGNVVGRSGDGGANPKPTLMFLGHVDTVPATIPVRVDGWHVYGRGAVDAKGPLAAAVAALSRVNEPRLVMVVGAVGEEGHSHGARHLLSSPPPAGLIVGEPGGSDGIVLGYKGSMRARVRFRQPAGHTAGPLATVCDSAVDAWTRVRSWCSSQSNGADGFHSLTPTLLRVESSSDGLVQKAVMDASFRLPPGICLDEVKAGVAAAAMPGEVEFDQADLAFQAAKSTGLVASFMRSIRAEGARPRFKHKTGTSDMNVVAPVWQCPTVAYGPGNSTLDHTPDEHIEIDEYLRGIRVLSRVFAEWLGPQGPRSEE